MLSGGTKVSKYDQVSKDALHFCRKIILKGATWGEHSSLVRGRFGMQFVAKRGYKDVFMACRQGVSDVRGYANSSIGIELDSIHSFFENRVRSIFKSSIGNCGEFTWVALYFCIRNNIEAEYYHATNIDHVFLVIGRAKGSDPNNPSTWGPDAMICDPWDNKSFLQVN